MTALDDLLSLSAAPDPLRPGINRGELEELQIRAASERLTAQRPAIPVLDRRCRETGVEAVRSRRDLVPLLFSHATYKSYPASFISRGQWDRLSLWLETVTAERVSAVDLAGVTDVDGWLARLRESGLHIVATSGTTGKNSFLLMDAADVDCSKDLAVALFGYPVRPARGNVRPATLLVPGNAAMRYCYSFRAYVEAFAQPGHAHTLTDEPMRIADSIRASALRKAMADGSITPGELAAATAEDERRRVRMDGAIRAVAERVLSYRDRPQIILGPWATWWRIMELARELGIPDGSFHPGTIASISGGLKGLTLPGDYEARMAQFLGAVQRPRLYSMSELSTVAPMCEAGYYHCAPWMILLVLDESGERLAEAGPDGWVTGRLAFYDPAWQSRWGGIVSGDRAEVGFGPCGCGRPGPVIRDSIARYSALSAGGDDKLTCGGTIEQYIRGVVGV